MRRRTQRAVCAALLWSACLLGCSAGLPQPTDAHLAVAQAEDAGVTLGDLERGRSLYVAKCGGCHALRDPAGLMPGAWGQELTLMQEQQGVELTASESRDVLRYLDAVTRVANR